MWSNGGLNFSWSCQRGEFELLLTTWASSKFLWMHQIVHCIECGRILQGQILGDLNSPIYPLSSWGDPDFFVALFLVHFFTQICVKSQNKLNVDKVFKRSAIREYFPVAGWPPWTSHVTWNPQCFTYFDSHLSHSSLNVLQCIIGCKSLLLILQK